MLGNLGFTEIAILLLILVLFFGAKRIPEIGRVDRRRRLCRLRRRASGRSA